MGTTAPIKREGNIPIIIIKPFAKPEPKRLNPGIPAPVFPRPLTIPAKEPVPAVRQKNSSAEKIPT